MVEKTCSRRGCSSENCKTFIDSIGYVCDECQQEFKDYLDSESIDATSSVVIKKELKSFLKKIKQSSGGDQIDIEDFFKSYTESEIVVENKPETKEKYDIRMEDNIPKD